MEYVNCRNSVCLNLIYCMQLLAFRGSTKKKKGFSLLLRFEVWHCTMQNQNFEEGMQFSKMLTSPTYSHRPLPPRIPCCGATSMGDRYCANVNGPSTFDLVGPSPYHFYAGKADDFSDGCQVSASRKTTHFVHTGLAANPVTVVGALAGR